MQCLVWHITYFVCLMGAMFLTIVLTIANPPHGPNGFPVFFIFFWLAAVGASFLNLVLGIVYAIKSYNGEWSGYPVIGQWVKRFL